MDDNTRRRDLVREGYDRISSAYRDDEGRSSLDSMETTSPYRAWLIELAGFLKPGARVLDLGCGNGLPGCRLLVEMGFETVGLDFSKVQLARARSLVPGATFVEADMAAWDAGPATFDAVVSLYSLIHVPLADQPPILTRIARWLRPHGLLLAIVGHERWSGIEDYHGAPMFWDHADGATYERWFAEAGLQVRWRRFIPEGPAGHDLILAGRSLQP